jgi:hypothetical protein
LPHYFFDLWEIAISTRGLYMQNPFLFQPFQVVSLSKL